MKLAIDARYLGKSGIGSFIEGVLYNLLENHKENYYLVILSDRNIHLNFENCDVIYTDIEPFTLKELFSFPVRAINKCDAFFTPYINIPYGIKIPIYSTIHDVIFLDINELVSKLGYIVRKLYIWRAIHMSKAIFTVSEFSKSRILCHFHTDKDIEVVYSGITSNLKNYTPHRIEKDDYYIYVGNIKQHKGIDLLLKAYFKAREQGLKSRLYIVGEYNNFRSSANLRGLLDDKDNIKFTGHVSDEKLYNLISSAKCLVLPSRYEGFGLPPLEALYLGTNVIISDIPVFKEIYKGLPVVYFKNNDVDSLTEILFEPQESIDIAKVRDSIDKRYNFTLTSNNILNYIEHNNK